MAYEIIWQPPARKRFHHIISYLQNRWGDKAVRNFAQRTEEVMVHLQTSPDMYRRSRQTGVRELVLTKHNMLLFRVKDDKVEILSIFDTRQHPRKKLKGL